MALLLTSTAFKYVYKETLPRVHYLTRLDYYMYTQLTFLMVQGLLHALASIALEIWGFSLQEVREMELKAFVIMALVWILGHFFLVNWAKRHRLLLDLDADELLEVLQDVERKDIKAEKARRRGLFSSSWWAGSRRRARTKSRGDPNPEQIEGGVDSSRSISTSLKTREYGIDDYELGNLFDMEDMDDDLESER